MTYTMMTFDAAILYDTPYKIPDFDKLERDLNARLARAGGSVGRTNMTGENFVTFRNDALYIVISFNREPLGPEGFQGALAAGINQMQNARFPEYVAEHIENIFITVGDGKMHLTPDARQMLEAQDMLGAVMDGVEAVDPRIKVSVLQSAVETVLDTIMPTPTVVHWCQTDLLHTADSFPRVTPDFQFASPLVSRPEFFDGGQTESGQQANAVVMRGSELFCGKTLFADTTTYSPQSLLTVLGTLIYHHIVDGLALDDGLTAQLDARVQWRLEHRPPHPMIPQGGIALIIEPVGTPPPHLRRPEPQAKKSWWKFGRKDTRH